MKIQIASDLHLEMRGSHRTLKSFLWMLRRDSPLHIRPAALPALIPWLLQFRSFCNGDDQKRGIASPRS